MFQYQKEIGKQEEAKQKPVNTGLVQKNERIGLDQPNVRVVQKKVAVFKPLEDKDNWTDEQNKFDKRAHEIDVEVQDAVNRLRSGEDNEIKEANRHYVRRYKELKSQYDESGISSGLAAAAGYVIESIVSSRIKYDTDVQLQVTGLVDQSRPDIVLGDPKVQCALLDITSSNNVGHIFDKKGNWTGHRNITYVAELLYPSIDFSTMGPIILTEDDKKEIRKRLEDKRTEMTYREKIFEHTLLYNQSIIIESLVNNDTYPLKIWHDRHWLTIESNFNHFYMDILPEVYEDRKEFRIKVEKTTCPNNLIYNHYSCDEMYWKTKALIQYINNRSLFGMPSWDNLRYNGSISDFFLVNDSEMNYNDSVIFQ